MSSEQNSVEVCQNHANWCGHCDDVDCGVKHDGLVFGPPGK